MEKISIIIPTYKRLDYLKKSVESIFNQTYNGDIEIIIIDGCKEEDYNSLSEYDNINYYYQEDHAKIYESRIKNAATARDIGIEKSTGEYIHFLDDDDMLRKDAIEKKVKLLKKSNEDINAVYNFVEKSDGSTREIPDERIGQELAYSLITLDTLHPFSTTFVKSKIAKDISPIKKLAHDDIGFTMELLIRTDINCIKEPLTIRNKTPETGKSNSSKKGRLDIYSRYNGLRKVLLSDKAQKNAQINKNILTNKFDNNN